ncbi:Proteolipid membrane potential modulator [Pustulibacterium marinum]|uniref:Proteolipid membrane potential modulator n=1 Tax=Pustulibacterium marinum TaxID=1224947 RepID=A0A1I7HL81_9FLAO|nr:YqaE/Pmp3 family membrane protein [Pustulibacterium marinum]SFU61527.1 Proteolipid membrane potential modulator [Pustulibacterium marinum]
MSIWRVILCIICPPLAVLDKGCGSVVITFILWLLGWVPGTIAALIIVNGDKKR